MIIWLSLSQIRVKLELFLKSINDFFIIIAIHFRSIHRRRSIRRIFHSKVNTIHLVFITLFKNDSFYTYLNLYFQYTHKNREQFYTFYHFSRNNKTVRHFYIYSHSPYIIDFIIYLCNFT